MVQKACEYLEKAPDRETTLKLIDTLRTVTAGKVCEEVFGALPRTQVPIPTSSSALSRQIHVEIERARLTMKLAKMREEEGKIAGAFGGALRDFWLFVRALL